MTMLCCQLKVKHDCVVLPVEGEAGEGARDDAEGTQQDAAGGRQAGQH